MGRRERCENTRERSSSLQRPKAFQNTRNVFEAFEATRGYHTLSKVDGKRCVHEFEGPSLVLRELRVDVVPVADDVEDSLVLLEDAIEQD